MIQARTAEKTTSPRGHTRHCSHPDCGKATREGKPYCPDHVEQHPYVLQILARLHEAQRLEKRAAAGKRVSVSDVVAQQIINHLRYRGAVTVERLARETMLHVAAVENYGQALVRKKIARWKTGSRARFLDLL